MYMSGKIHLNTKGLPAIRAFNAWTKEMVSVRLKNLLTLWEPETHNREDPNERRHNETFHLGLFFLFRLKRSSEK